jgi:predicted Zn-dependent peptidase
MNLSVAFPGLSITDPDRYALDLLSLVLGEGMSSRLFIELRENLGLAYDIHSGVTHYRDSGAFVVTAGVDPGRTYEAVETVLAELAKVKDGVPEAELAKAKHLGAGRLMLQMEDTRAVSGWNGTQELLKNGIYETDEVVDRINETTSEEVDRIANRLLQTERLNLAVVGPCRGRKRLERMLRV